jgi:hypothetical protein
VDYEARIISDMWRNRKFVRNDAKEEKKIIEIYTKREIKRHK